MQSDAIDRVALSIAGKATKRAMEVQGLGSFYEREYMKKGRDRLAQSLTEPRDPNKATIKFRLMGTHNV